MSKLTGTYKVCIFDTNNAVAETIANRLLDLSKERKNIHIALSGGNTPKFIFQFIAHSRFKTLIEWSQLHFWWGDERCVPATDDQSNYGEAMRILFSQVLIPADNLHPIHGELDPEKACIEFKDEMEACLPFSQINHVARPVFDWVILGVGEDGHTASLFPGKTNFETKQNAVIAQHPETAQPRISLSAPVLCAAQCLTFLAFGETKKEIVAAILASNPNSLNLPAAKISTIKGLTEWYLDIDAACHIKKD